MNEEFWELLDRLVAQSEIVIDRPKGSAHPRYPHLLHEVAYGYLKNTASPDGDGIDVWVGTGSDGVVGIVCTVDAVKRDSEIKILLNCSESERDTILKFHNRTQSMKGILIERGADALSDFR